MCSLLLLLYRVAAGPGLGAYCATGSGLGAYFLDLALPIFLTSLPVTVSFYPVFFRFSLEHVRLVSVSEHWAMLPHLSVLFPSQYFSPSKIFFFKFVDIMYSFSRATRTKYQKLGALSSRNVLFHNSGCWRSKIKVSVGLVSSEANLADL